MTERGRYQFGSTCLTYTTERSPRRRSVSVVVDPEDGVLVKVPVDMEPERIQAVVSSRATWIVQRLAEYRQVEEAIPPREFVGGESHWLQGRQYRLRLQPRVTRRAKAWVEGRFIAVEVPPELVETKRREAVREALVELYRATAAERLPERVSFFAERLGVPVPQVLIRDQEKRWGSCTKQGEIRFNWRLIMAPMALVDYVVAHEVCHLRQPDHSPAFWRLLGSVIPDYNARRERLRIEGIRFHL